MKVTLDQPNSDHLATKTEKHTEASQVSTAAYFVVARCRSGLVLRSRTIVT